MFPLKLSNERTFFLATLICTAAYIIVSEQVMQLPTMIPAIAFALLGSVIPLQLIARFWERRWMLPPRTQFQGFIYGDGVYLPLAIGALAALSHQAGPIGQSWSRVALAASIVIAITFRILENNVYRFPAYKSPTKIFHDFFAVTVLSFLVIKYLPAAIHAPLTIETIGLRALTLIGLAKWAHLVFVVDRTGPQPSNAHIWYHWNTDPVLRSRSHLIEQGYPFRYFYPFRE